MAIITLNFSEPINVSCQIGDIAYYVPVSSLSYYLVNSSNVIEIGPVIIIASDRLSLQATTFSPAPPINAFTLFSKDNKVNLSSLLGYYAELDIRNNNTSEHGEMFGINGDYFESSK